MDTIGSQFADGRSTETASYIGAQKELFAGLISGTYASRNAKEVFAESFETLHAIINKGIATDMAAVDTKTTIQTQTAEVTARSSKETEIKETIVGD